MAMSFAFRMIAFGLMLRARMTSSEIARRPQVMPNGIAAREPRFIELSVCAVFLGAGLSI
jgi:hypothetical protein